MAIPGKKRPVDLVELTCTAAALTGILAAQRSRPDYHVICREALALGARVAASLRNGRRQRQLRKATNLGASARRA